MVSATRHEASAWWKMGETSRWRAREASDMKAFILGAAVGYVLGAKAGRGRYDQIMRTYRKIADHPAVQGAAGVARAKIGEKTGGRGRTTTQQTNGRREPAFTQS